jgi:ketosteroid isomerase-like protein
MDAKQRRREQRRLARLRGDETGPPGDDEVLATLVETYRWGFEALDAAALTSIWDPDFDVIHCPIERAEPVRGSAAIAAYYEGVVARFARVDTMTISNLTIEVLGDAAFAFLDFHFAGDLADGSGPFALDGRDTFVFRRRGESWAAIHYHGSQAGRR